jgi:hypothetical protein
MVSRTPLISDETFETLYDLNITPYISVKDMKQYLLQVRHASRMNNETVRAFIDSYKPWFDERTRPLKIRKVFEAMYHDQVSPDDLNDENMIIVQDEYFPDKTFTTGDIFNLKRYYQNWFNKIPSPPPPPPKVSQWGDQFLTTPRQELNQLAEQKKRENEELQRRIEENNKEIERLTNSVNEANTKLRAKQERKLKKAQAVVRSKADIVNQIAIYNEHKEMKEYLKNHKIEHEPQTSIFDCILIKYPELPQMFQDELYKARTSWKESSVIRQKAR